MSPHSFRLLDNIKKQAEHVRESAAYSRSPGHVRLGAPHERALAFCARMTNVWARRGRACLLHEARATVYARKYASAVMCMNACPM